MTDSNTMETRFPYTYVPYKENILNTFEGITGYCYSILGNTLYISLIPSQDIVDNNAIRLNYFQKLTPLIQDISSNWLSENNPECYIFGLMVEINAFKKDSGAMAMWQERFNDAIESVKFQDTEYRWNGPTLFMRAV